MSRKEDTLLPEISNSDNGNNDYDIEVQAPVAQTSPILISQGPTSMFNLSTTAVALIIAFLMGFHLLYDPQIFSINSHYLYPDLNNTAEFHVHDLCTLDRFVKIDIISVSTNISLFSGTVQASTFENQNLLNNFSHSFIFNTNELKNLLYLNTISFDHITLKIQFDRKANINLQNEKFEVIVTTENRSMPSEFYYRYALFYTILLIGFCFLCQNQFNNLQWATIALMILGIITSFARALDYRSLINIFDYAFQIYFGIVYQLSINKSLFGLFFVAIYIIALFLPIFYVTLSNQLLDSITFTMCKFCFIVIIATFVISTLTSLLTRRCYSIRYLPVCFFIMITYYFNFCLKYSAFDWKNNSIFQALFLIVPMAEATATSLFASLHLPDLNKYIAL